MFCLKRFRTVASRSKGDRSLTTRVFHTVKPTTTSREAHCALAATNPSQDDASPPCSRNSTPSTLFALSASSSSTREPSKSRTTSLTVTTASRNSSAKPSQVLTIDVCT